MTNAQPPTEGRIRALLVDITYKPALLEAPRDARLEDVGVDSAAMIDLLYRLEEAFDITIGDNEVTPENFATIASLTDLVGRKCPS